VKKLIVLLVIVLTVLLLITSVIACQPRTQQVENLRWLTEDEKEKAINIALGTPEAGIKIGQAGEPNNIMYYYAMDDGAGGAVVVWNYSENGNKFLHAQRMDAEGNKLWGDSGIKVSSVSPYWAGYSTPARISPDVSGGFFITWAAGEHIKDKTSSYIQRISGEGEILWGEDGIRLDS